jgi:hypothetical protein
MEYLIKKKEFLHIVFKRTPLNPESFNDKKAILMTRNHKRYYLSILPISKMTAQFSNYEIIVLGHSLGAYCQELQTKSTQILK